MTDSPQIKIISFDLDNTLYDNRPIIASAEHESHKYLEYEFSKQGKQYSKEMFIALRKFSIKSSPIEFENLSHLRQTILDQLCVDLDGGELIAKEAMDLFLARRIPQSVPTEIISMLEKLQEKYKLVAVTNGNCEVNKMSIGKYFCKDYSPQDGYRAKPHPEMLQQILREFKISPAQLLHIGDQEDSDGKAAENADCPFIYFAPFDKSNLREQTIQLLNRISLRTNTG